MVSKPQAYQLARNTEAQVNAQLKMTRPSSFVGGSQYRGSSYNSSLKGTGSIRDFGQGKREFSLNLNKNTNKRLTSTEMNKRRQKALCFFCEEKFFPGHKYGGSESLYFLEV